VLVISALHWIVGSKLTFYSFIVAYRNMVATKIVGCLRTLTIEDAVESLESHIRLVELECMILLPSRQGPKNHSKVVCLLQDCLTRVRCLRIRFQLTDYCPAPPNHPPAGSAGGDDVDLMSVIAAREGDVTGYYIGKPRQDNTLW